MQQQGLITTRLDGDVIDSRMHGHTVCHSEIGASFSAPADGSEILATPKTGAGYVRTPRGCSRKSKVGA